MYFAGLGINKEKKLSRELGANGRHPPALLFPSPADRVGFTFLNRSKIHFPGAPAKQERPGCGQVGRLGPRKGTFQGSDEDEGSQEGQEPGFDPMKDPWPSVGHAGFAFRGQLLLLSARARVGCSSLSGSF